VSLDKTATAKAGKPVWIARVSLGVIDGRRVRHKVRASSERGARAELERLRRLYDAGGEPATMTIDEYLRTWLTAHRRIRQSTVLSYRNHIELHIGPLLGGIPVAKLRPADVDRLIANRLKAGLSPATVGRIVTTLRIALNAGVRRGELVDNVASRVDLPRVEREPVKPLTPEEAGAILDAVAGHWTEHIVRLLLGSGLRIGEACALNQGDLVLDQGFVRLRESKTRIRAVPITEDAVDALRAAVARAPRFGPDEPVFFGERRNREGHRDRLERWSVSHAFPRILERAGLDHLTPHGLRHGAATLMTADGIPLPVIAKQLGHRSTNMTARYAHVVPEAQRSAIAALDVRKRASNASPR
jgi:integrase